MQHDVFSYSGSNGDMMGNTCICGWSALDWKAFLFYSWLMKVSLHYTIRTDSLTDRCLLGSYRSIVRRLLVSNREQQRDVRLQRQHCHLCHQHGQLLKQVRKLACVSGFALYVSLHMSLSRSLHSVLIAFLHLLMTFLLTSLDL